MIFGNIYNVCSLKQKENGKSSLLDTVLYTYIPNLRDTIQTLKRV